MTERLILIGASTRAAAQSAVRSGLSVCCLDQFGDQDLRECAGQVKVVENWPEGILDVLDQIPRGQLVITGALENSPQILTRLRDRFSFAGCSAEAIGMLRDPVRVQEILKQAGLHWLRVSLSGPPDLQTETSSRWLRKPLHSAAGFHVRFCRTDRPAAVRPAETGCSTQAAGFYYQEYVEGTAVSGLFLSDGAGCRLLGLTRQLIGLPQAGSSGFRYCGSIGPLSTDEIPERAFQLARRIGQTLVEATGCRGLFGCDFLWNTDTETLPVCEVNPRYVASAEVLENVCNVPLIQWHLDACRGQLPADIIASEPTSLAGRLICFAKQPVQSADVTSLSAEICLADIPREGIEIPAGHPICTVLATGASESAVRSRLLAAAERVLG